MHIKHRQLIWSKIWVTNGDSYINNNVPFFADKGIYDDGIMEEIVNKRTEAKESPATEYDDEDSEPMISHDAPRSCADFIYSRAHASFKQTTLDSFFLRRFSIIVCGYNQLMFVTSYWKFA